MSIYIVYKQSRSREGAWIEMRRQPTHWPHGTCRSREGAWIEIDNADVTPEPRPSLPRGSVDLNCTLRGAKRCSISRSREGAWIEIAADYNVKLGKLGRSREGAWIEMIFIGRLLLILASLPRGSVD